MLTIRDDGNGIVPRLSETDGHRGTGMELVQAMSRQLGGEFVVSRLPAGGTCATIRFEAKFHPKTQAFICNSK